MVLHVHSWPLSFIPFGNKEGHVYDLYLPEYSIYIGYIHNDLIILLHEIM